MAAREKAPAGPVPIESIQHPDKRLNIPTADAQEWLDDEHRGVPHVAFERDPSLDPQLVWRGKFDDDVNELVADAPPLYIQEKIDARVLVENLRKTAKSAEEEPEATLFDDFDGLDILDKVDFYQHDANWSNRMILGDSLQVMASLAEREDLRGKVQMIYIDPPYGIKFKSNWQASTRNREVKDGKASDVAREVEQIKAFRDTWELGIHSYLSYLRDRLTVARELLTESGSIFVQIGDENVHVVRDLLDELFGPENFIAQIAYRTTTGATSEFLAGTMDYVLWFGKHRPNAKFRRLYEARQPSTDPNYRFIDESGEIRGLTKSERDQKDSLYITGASILRQNPLTSQSGGEGTIFPVALEGTVFKPGKGGWKTNATGMERLILADRLLSSGKTLGFKRYFADFPFAPYSNAWEDTRQSGFGDPKVYVVQTATKVIERCILMASDPGDLVLDPTCGSGTTAFVAEQRGRRWITIDTSRVALALARQRLMGARYPKYLLADSPEGRAKSLEVHHTAPPREPATDEIRRGFVYERVQHITLKSIANNPDIREGMSRAEIDAAIKRHAEFETLFDRPYEDKSRVRVSGPFTVESLSPHRSLSLTPDTEPASEALAATAGASRTFEQSILDNLQRAGIQNGAKAERIEFATFEPYAGSYVQAVGERRQDEDADGGAPSRVAIAVGPQYGTVDQTFVKEAAREAIRAEGVELLCVLGFAFDAQALGSRPGDDLTVETSGGFTHVAERSVGKVQVLYVRMNVDLLMGEALKKTGAGNLFTVFGEPDIEIHRHGGGDASVTLHGVDIYDPTTGEIRSDSTDKIALWMIDTNYDGESFFVRHCYFTGGNDPLKRLKTALKADIDADAWASLYKTTSRAFPAPTTGKIAVKVINDYGDEVMKVFEVA